jgi:GMP synthase (glutamine-hydrolysing)
VTRRALCIRHIAFEGLGSWYPVLHLDGFEIDYVEAGEGPLPDPLAPDLLIVLGGPIGVYEQADYPFLRDEIAFIARRIEKNLPTIGVCLGAQLLAAAAGAKVYPAGVTEIGFMPVNLTDAGYDSCLGVFADEPLTLHWHGDTFDLPARATLLASTDLVPHQAFALGDKILGVQFHPEWGEQSLEPWLIGHTGHLRANNIDVPAFRAEAERLRPHLAEKAWRVMEEFLAQSGLAR